MITQRKQSLCKRQEYLKRLRKAPQRASHADAKELRHRRITLHFRHEYYSLVEKGAIKLPDGIHVPDGTRVRLEIEAAGANRWPADYFERTAGALAGEALERPVQGDAPLRGAW